MEIENLLKNFEEDLRQKDKSEKTVQKYLGNLRLFAHWCQERERTQTLLAEYKKFLMGRYLNPSTVNSHLISLNLFCRFAAPTVNCRIALLPVQKKFCYEKEITKDEFYRLSEYLKGNNYKMFCILQTLTLTGIRVGELKWISKERLEQGWCRVYAKNKFRIIVLPDLLVEILKEYCNRKILSGSVFQNANGAPISPAYIWRELKKAAEKTGVEKNRVFPHNFRHLFACEYLKKYHNIFELADILGHSNVETTRLYVKTDLKTQKTHMESLFY